ncbi:MAG: hypothetical protein U1B80_04950, partial [Anaerolineaceae bacterium]|nr:hypothetical protein [Anaerolineaceae bacterium]
MLNHLGISTESNIIDSEIFLDQIDIIRTDFQKSLNKERQSEMGQFLTRPSIARMMASMFTFYPKEISLVDPGAGVGSLSAAFISNAVQAYPRPDNISITAFELDSQLVKGLEITLNRCKQLCSQYNINLQFDIRQEDFISSSVEI